MESLYVPDYYPEFHCIAEKCPHTCCAGWEIDIDPESLKKYQTMPGAVGDRLRRGMDREGETAFFHLDEKGRCPMLNEQNLCTLILNCGEEALCQICRDHPRFRNFLTGRVEMGLGLVCPEACRLILSRPSPMKLICLKRGEERLTRQEEQVLRARDMLLAACHSSGPAARLWEYLVFRHIAPAAEDGQLARRIGFVRKTHRRLLEGWTDGQLPTLMEECRIFSDQVEYDSEVLEKAIFGGKER